MISTARIIIILFILMVGTMMALIYYYNPHFIPTEKIINYECENGSIESYNISFLRSNPSHIICYDEDKYYEKTEIPINFSIHI